MTCWSSQDEVAIHGGSTLKFGLIPKDDNDHKTECTFPLSHMQKLLEPQMVCCWLERQYSGRLMHSAEAVLRSKRSLHCSSWALGSVVISFCGEHTFSCSYASVTRVSVSEA